MPLVIHNSHQLDKMFAELVLTTRGCTESMPFPLPVNAMQAAVLKNLAIPTHPKESSTTDRGHDSVYRLACLHSAVLSSGLNVLKPPSIGLMSFIPVVFNFSFISSSRADK